MVAPTKTRQPKQTAGDIEQQIRQQTEQNVAYFSAHREQIDDRLRELEQEWDQERVLETLSGSVTLLGLLLGTTRNRLWYLLTLAAPSFLIQHAVQGWCPPLPVIRRLGVRTREEIDREKYALKALRGDFKDLPDVQGDVTLGQVSQLLQSVGK